MRPCVLAASAVRLACCCVPFCFLVLAVGCKNTPRSAEHVDVSGRVLYKNKPLTGGKVTFVTIEGAFASTGIIDEKGNYTVKAPVGASKISIDNTMLNPSAKAAKLEAKTKGAGRPGEPEASPLKGTYVKIPDKYTMPDTSGLDYTVTKGAQTHDIELPD